MFAYLFAIPEQALPENWNEFLAYNERMWNSDQLTVNDAAKEIAYFLFHFNRALQPVMNRYEIVTALMMPERLRQQYGMPMDTSKNRDTYERYIRRMRSIFPKLPDHLRYLPPYMEAQRRLAGKHKPGVVTGSLNKLMLGTARLVSV